MKPIPAVLLLLLSGSLLAGCARRTSEAEMEARFGIQLLGVRLNAQSYLVDVRYRVTDAKKAAPLLATSAKPRLMDETSGDSLYVPNFPKLGTLRAKGNAEAGRSYFILFGNPRGLVKSGGKVTLAIGDLKLSHLTVE